MNSLEYNIPFLIIFKSLSCFSVTTVFTESRMNILLRILVSNTCLHGPLHIFNQLTDLISTILPEFSDQVFEGIDVICKLMLDKFRFELSRI